MSDHTTLKWILESSKELHTDQYKELFKIVQLHKQKYTENSNGIFIDLEKLSPLCISKITQYLKYNQENSACASGVRDDIIENPINLEPNTNNIPYQFMESDLYKDEKDENDESIIEDDENDDDENEEDNDNFYCDDDDNDE